MKLVLPCEKYKNSYYELIKMAELNGEISKLGNAQIKNGETFNMMLNRLKNRRRGLNISKSDVPATVYWIIEKNKIVGTIDLRHKLNKSYYERLGHIAYYIKPSERNKGYATKALALAKQKYAKKFISKILVTCYEDNAFSSKVIEKNGGILKEKVKDEVANRIILKYVIKILDDNIVVPKTAWLTTNRNCNNNCTWCYASKCNDKIMDFDKIKDCIDELYKLGIQKIILIGGEPTIYNDLIKTIRYATKKGIEVSMASNGRKFSDYNFASRIVKAGLKNCNISIKGFNEDEYVKNTNAIGFNEMVAGYHNLKKLGINVSTSYVLCDNDYQNFDKFLSSFIDNNLNNISFQLYKPSVDGETYAEAPTISDLARICEYAFEKIKNTNINYSFEMSIPLCSLNELVLEEMISKKCLTTCCHITKGTGIIFDSNFNVLPCNHFVNKPLNDTPIEKGEILNFWNSKIPTEFRKAIKTYPDNKCVNCSKWSQCGGGCFLRWIASDPSIYINDKYMNGGE